ncbi:hypothetical protein FB451DRAFT_1186622 [Mycena latifolia]|nr:hypothetical protein FB451DRAFT_1186622 [Mycena latifolia]
MLAGATLPTCSVDEFLDEDECRLAEERELRHFWRQLVDDAPRFTPAQRRRQAQIITFYSWGRRSVHCVYPAAVNEENVQHRGQYAAEAKALDDDETGGAGLADDTTNRVSGDPLSGVPAAVQPENDGPVHM